MNIPCPYTIFDIPFNDQAGKSTHQLPTQLIKCNLLLVTYFSLLVTHHSSLFIPNSPMLLPTDLLRLPYTPDLTEGGIAYALQSLPYSFERGDWSTYNRLRRQVASTAVELAFRRHLTQSGVPFEVKPAITFTDHERFDVILGGRRCDLKSFLISHRDQIKTIRQHPATLLDASALVPLDIHAGDGHSYNDLYIFAFVTGLISTTQADLKQIMVKGMPHHLIHVMPTAWRKPTNWTPLGEVVLKTESSEALIVEVSGQVEGRGLMRETVNLLPKTKVKLKEAFYSISSLHVRRIPEARVGIYSKKINQTHLIAAAEWGNLWVYGMDIFFAGFLPYEEFGQHAALLIPNSKTFQYNSTHVKNLAMPVLKLRSMEKLFESMGKKK